MQSCIMPGLSTHLVQVLNVGTVDWLSEDARQRLISETHAPIPDPFSCAVKLFLHHTFIAGIKCRHCNSNVEGTLV